MPGGELLSPTPSWLIRRRHSLISGVSPPWSESWNRAVGSIPLTVTRDPDEPIAGVKVTVIKKSARSLRSATEAPTLRSAGRSASSVWRISSGNGGLSPTGLIATATAGRRCRAGVVQPPLMNAAATENRTAKIIGLRFMDLPNVKDEPRPQRARRVPQYDSDSSSSIWKLIR